MRKLVSVAAVAVSALFVAGASSPASAAMGQCFDGYGRPTGSPYNTDNPPYGFMCSVFRRGGSCTHVGQGWAESNCGIAPRYRYYRDDRYREDYRYRRRNYDY